MTNNLSVFVQGGTVSLGNITQGNENQVTASVSVSVIDQSFQRTRSGISTLGGERQVPIDQIEKVIVQLEKLLSESKTPTPEYERGATILNAIRDNYSWAYPLVKDFLAVAWPALLSIAA